jgi:phage terminase large subunit-like protein
MHQLRVDINEMTPEEVDALIRGLGDDAAEDWVFAARDAQLPPPDLSWCWLFLGGRGAGKSHSMSAAVHTAVRAGISRIHFIAPTTTDFHDVNVEGKSGIFATCGRDPRPRWVSSRRRLEWPNGAMCVFFSGEELESLRGPQCELCIIDEIGRMRYQQSVFDTMMLGLRLGDRPRVLLATIFGINWNFGRLFLAATCSVSAEDKLTGGPTPSQGPKCYRRGRACHGQ